MVIKINSLIRYELKKIISVKKAVLLLAFILSIALIYLFSHIQNYEYSRMLKQEYSEFSGPVSDEKAVSAENKYEAFMMDLSHYDIPEQYLNTDINELNSIISFNTYYLADEYKSAAEALKTISSEAQTAADYKSNFSKLLKSMELSKAAEKKYSDLRINFSEPIIGYCEAWRLFVEFTVVYAPLILGFILILLISPVFTKEYVSSVGNIIISTKNGKSRVIIAKVTASLICAGAVFIILTLINLLLLGLVFGFDGYNVSMFAGTNEIFTQTPYGFTYLSYLFYYLAFGITGVVFFTLSLLTISCMFKSYVTSMSTAFLIYYIPAFTDLLTYNYMQKNDLSDILYFTNYSMVQASSYVSRFRSFEFGDVSVPVIYFSVIFFIFISVINISFLFVLFKRSAVEK